MYRYGTRGWKGQSRRRRRRLPRELEERRGNGKKRRNPRILRDPLNHLRRGY